MGKIEPNQPFILNGKARRMAYCLAALISLGTASSISGWAESANDLVISKEGANVNVNLNTASSSDVSIRRSDDLMVIRVPKSYKGGLSIDPSLKKNSVVQEIETPTGKAITIQSQQIYLHTWDGEPGTGPQPMATPAKVEQKSSDSPPKEETGPGKAGFLTISPTDSNAKLSKSSGSKEKSKHKTAVPEPAPISPLDLTRLLNQGSLLSAPVMGEQTGNSQPEKPQTSRIGSQTKAEHHTKKGKSKVKTNQQLVPAPSTDTQKADIPTVSGDPETEPLEADSKRQAIAIQASMSGMLRIFLSLGVVLALVVACIKMLLPQLMERYPEFFERLREGKQWSGETPNNLFANWPKAAKTPAPPAPKPLAATPSQALVQHQEPSKKSYLERLQVAGEYFQVLQTTILGKGKELHLVELKGKQFLVATTPYTVTLLKDLSEEEGPSQPTHSPFVQPRPKQIEPQRSAAPPLQAKRLPTESAPVKSETIAYLSDETPIRRVSPSKPYATSPGQAQPTQRKSVAPQFPAPPNEVYQTYLPKPNIDPNRIQSAQSTPAAARATASSGAPPSYIDAEEVVVLEDYDDVYGH